MTCILLRSGLIGFGWVLLGTIPSLEPPERYSCPVGLIALVEALMSRFWQFEELESAPEDFAENGKCEVTYQ